MTALVAINSGNEGLDGAGPTTMQPSDERQVLLIMLLAQVCSLHDSTPRTFVIHVLSLYERGVLDEER